jgi:BirA family biotin operon repressor/biotin-[acetyl-CoA-carboxylase] ligase
MAFALGPRAAQAGYDLAGYDSIGSTNSEALARLRAGERGPCWIAARAQTAGRGRRGRTWSTAEGNLAATLLTVVKGALPVVATLGFVAGLTMRRALADCTQGLKISLKWPNDVLIDGGKVGGILLESEVLNDGIGIAVGFGVNVVSAPSETPFPATSLDARGQSVGAEHLFAALSDAWVGYFARWDEGRGLEIIRQDWLACAEGVGRAVSIQTGEGTLTGVFQTLDERGRLILRTESGELVPITAGDVYFGPVATARPKLGAH